MRTCPNCGNALPPNAPSGHCPSCLLRIGLAVADGGLANGLEEGAMHESPTAEPDPSASTARIRYVGDYELLEEIGRGGMGVVYRARQSSLNRLVALKLVRAGEFADEKEVARFRAEAEAAAHLDHPNIVPIHEVGEHEGRHYFSMKLVEGGTLSERITNPQSPISNHAAARLVVTVARAVHYAHQRGLLHRDLKPGNILLDTQGVPHVTDFGLAKRIDTDSAITQSGAIVGTPNYMAPEQAAGAKQLTTAADIYSLGAIFYELLAGRPPFVGATVMETLQKVMNKEPMRPSMLGSRRRQSVLTSLWSNVRRLTPAATSIDRDLETVCLKCLEKDPARRYGSAEALADDLERWLLHEPIRARPVTSVGRLGLWCRRKPAVAGLAAVSLLATLLGLAGILWQWRAAISARNDAQLANQRSREQLWNSSVAQARTERLTGAAGARRRALVAITNAARIRPSLELRNEAIAALSLTDLDDKVVYSPPGDAVMTVAKFATDALGRHFSIGTRSNGIVVGDLTNGNVTVRLPAVTKTPGSRRIALSRDGRFVGEVQPGGEFTLWKIETQQEAWRGQVFSDNYFNTKFAFHPTRPLVVLRTDTNALRLAELETGKLAGTIPLPVLPLKFALSPDGEKVASIVHQRCLVSDSINGAIIGQLTNRTSISAFAWHPDGRHLAVGNDAGEINYWNIYNGTTETWWRTPRSVELLAFNPHGTLLASSHGIASLLWDVGSGERLVGSSVAKIHGFTPSGERVVWSGNDFGYLSVHEPAHCRTFPIPAGAGPPNFVEFSPDGRWVVTSHGNGILLWNLETGKLSGKALTETNAWPMAYHVGFTLDSKSVLTRSLYFASRADTFLRWSIITNEASGLPALGAPRRIRSGGALGTLEDRITLPRVFPEELKIWSRERGSGGDRVVDSQTAALIYQLPGPQYDSWCVSRTTNWIAVCGTNSLQLLRFSGEPIDLTKGHPRSGHGTVLLSPDSRRLAYFGPKLVEMFATDDGRLLWSQEDTGGDPTFSYDARLLAVVSGLSTIRLLDSTTGNEVATLTLQENVPVTDITFSGGKDTLAIAHERKIVLWDLRSLRRDLARLGLDWPDENPGEGFAPRR